MASMTTVAFSLVILSLTVHLGDTCFATGLCGGLNAGCGAFQSPLFRPPCASGGCGNLGLNYLNQYSNLGAYGGLGAYSSGLNGFGMPNNYALGGNVCGPYGCYRHRTRAAPTLKKEQLAGFSNETLTHINNLAALSPSAAYNFVSSEKAAMNPNRVFYQCCVDRRLPNSCLKKCNFGTYRKEILGDMYMKKDECPIEAMQEIHFCAAQGRDHRQCCQRNGVSTTLAGEKCLVFCDQRPGKVVQLDMTYLPCFERFESMKTCFYNDIARRH